MAEYILELRETSPLKSVRLVCKLWAWNSLILILLMLSLVLHLLQLSDLEKIGLSSKQVDI